MTVNEKVFKAYDIRGLCPEEITEELAYLVGKAFVTHLGCKRVVVGMDMRSTSKALFDSLAKGLTEMGADVTDIGMVTTPMLNFSVAHLKFDGGIVISASHNPGSYNAFKLIRPPALQMGAGSGMEEIKDLVLKDEWSPAQEKGNITTQDVLDSYLEHVRQFTANIKDIKIIADYGNGVGAVSAKPLLDSLPVSVKHLYPEPDGTFPNHEANPHEIKNFRSIQQAIKEEGADIGLFFDGDADRCSILDEDGKIVFPDMLISIISKYRLGKYDDKRVYCDLRFSKATYEEVKANGGEPIMVRVGNPFYKEKLMKDGGAFASEFSGHMMFSDNYGIDDGLFAAVMILDILCTTGKKLSELVEPMQKYVQTEEINTRVTDADVVMDEARKKFSDGKSIEIDGVLIQFPDWWFSLRRSNTEPLVRLRIEADNAELLAEKRRELTGLIDRYKA